MKPDQDARVGGRKKPAALPGDLDGVKSHDLFPDLKDDDRPVARIRVFRWNPKTGTFPVCPRTFAPNELADLEVFHSVFGGGRYELWALDARGRMVTKKLWQLEGRPLPFPGQGEGELEPEVPTPAPSSPAAPDQNGLVAILLQSILSQNAQAVERAREDAAARERASREHMTLMLGMFEKLGQRPDHTPLIAALAPMFPVLLEKLTGGGGHEKLLELALTFAKQKASSGEVSDSEIKEFGESVAMVLASAAQLKESTAKETEAQAKVKEVEARTTIAQANVEATRNLAAAQQAAAAQQRNGGASPPAAPPPTSSSSAPPGATA